MVKRVKRASAVVFDHPTPSSYQPLAEDHSRARLKIQSLQDDYEELAKENDAMKRRLQMAKNQKRLLSSQVRFLREKYMLLSENPRNPTFRPPRPEEGHRTMSSRNKPPPRLQARQAPFLPYYHSPPRPTSSGNRHQPPPLPTSSRNRHQPPPLPFHEDGQTKHHHQQQQYGTLC